MAVGEGFEPSCSNLINDKQLACGQPISFIYLIICTLETKGRVCREELPHFTTLQSKPAITGDSCTSTLRRCRSHKLSVYIPPPDY